MLEERFSDKPIHWITNQDLKMITFPNFSKYSSSLTHAFSTRIGGVSTGKRASLNLGWALEDKDTVSENYKRVAETLSIPLEAMVLTKQVHGDTIRIVTSKDAGNGIFQENNLGEFDAIATKEKNLPLVTFYADCVPILMYDPIKQVIAMAHSGWRGTVQNIGGKLLQRLKMEFNCDPGNVEIVLGPSIAECCFEVGPNVYEEFCSQFNFMHEASKNNGEGKYFVDLHKVIIRSLLEVGADQNKILNSCICTSCHNDVFYSFRSMKEKTGSLAAFMMLK